MLLDSLESKVARDQQNLLNVWDYNIDKTVFISHFQALKTVFIMVLGEIKMVLNPSEVSYMKIYSNHNFQDSASVPIYCTFNYLICYYSFFLKQLHLKSM